MFPPLACTNRRAASAQYRTAAHTPTAGLSQSQTQIGARHLRFLGVSDCLLGRRTPARAQRHKASQMSSAHTLTNTRAGESLLSARAWLSGTNAVLTAMAYFSHPLHRAQLRVRWPSARAWSQEYGKNARMLWLFA